MANGVRHRIDTSSNRPLQAALRRHLTVMVEAVVAHVDAMLKADLVEPARLEWASNVVMMMKTYGRLRFRVDYRQLNERAVKDSYSLSRIDVCLDAFARATWFSAFDLRSGYHQVEMDPGDSGKTTFVSDKKPSGLRLCRSCCVALTDECGDGRSALGNLSSLL